MPPLASTAISQATSFLNQQFSRGSDVPYDPQFQRLIRQHLLDLVGDIPSLTLKREQYTDNYGSSSRLIVAEGTVPMYYQNVKYNIPLALWLPERYPMQPPLMYVVPTPDMVIKPRHSFVDPSGLVSSPYLSNWAYPDSNLRELAQDASIMFSSDPPLYSKPPGWTPPPARPAQPPGGASGGPQPSPGPGAGAGPQGPPGRPPYPGPPPPGGMPQPGGMYGQPGSPPHMHNPMHYPGFGAAPSYPGQAGGSFTSQSSNMYPPMTATGSGFAPAGSGFGPAGGGFAPAGSGFGTAGSGGSAMSGASSGGTGGGGGGGYNSPWGYNPAAMGPMESGAMGPPQEWRPPSPPKPTKEQLQSNAAEETRRELQGTFRATSLAALSRRLAASVAAASAGAAGEVERLGDAQAELARREALLQQEVAALQSERVALDKAAQELGGAATQLDSWLTSNERAVEAVAGAGEDGSSAAGQPDPDSAIVAADALSQQAMEVQAQDLALEDALYALDKALNAGLVQPDAYLKQVRAVCRQQFMARALGNKIAAKQNEERRRRAAQPAPAGAYGPAPVAGPHGGVPMPIGDSWYSTGILPNPLAPMAAQR